MATLTEAEEPKTRLFLEENYAEYLTKEFDPNDHAQASVRSDDGDLSNSLQRLSANIDGLKAYLDKHVAENTEELLERVYGITHLEKDLEGVKLNVSSMSESLVRLRNKVKVPYEQILGYTTQLERLQNASDVLRRVMRFLQLAQRLETQVQGGDREFTQTALSLRELDKFLSDPDLEGIDVIDAEKADISRYRTQVVEAADRLLLDGLQTQNQADIASGLQIFYNLNEMEERVCEILNDINDSVLAEIQVAFDMNSLQKELRARRIKDLSNPGTAAWSMALWSKLETLMDRMGEACNKVYLLDRVLSLKRDPTTHVSFQEGLLQSLEGSVVNFFWRNLAANFEAELNDAGNRSTILQQTLQIGYPKLLSLFHQFFSRIAVYTGYTLGPEAILMLNTISAYESSYLAKSSSRLLEMVNSTFPTSGFRMMPRREEFTQAMKIIAGELDLVKFDRQLLAAVSKNIVKCLTSIKTKLETWISRDNSAYVIIFSGGLTASQNNNIEIVNNMYYFRQAFIKFVEDLPHDMHSTFDNSLDIIQKLYQGVIQGLLRQFLKELELVILKVHREDFGSSNAGDHMSSNASQYIGELAGKLRHIQREYLSKFSCGDEGKEWVIDLTRRVVIYFLRHASMAHPLSEMGKLKLTGDMTQLEFVINQILAIQGLGLSSLGEAYRALRAFRFLMFLDLEEIPTSSQTESLPYIYQLHHLFVRSDPNIPMPHVYQGQTELQYSDWLDAHSDLEAYQLVSQCLDNYSKNVQQQNKPVADTYPILRQVLEKAISHTQ
ncbi:hypothetical protein K493DRAFT_348325 [Basidiobolus meristosporus CBS 931.73]|uniref:Conserved oligomeric Golgi complex subunit 5 n=1 Tax=Basidiobolus meristosporus CBS 931.73 TaxID=1314790 RepID=A0A1Y1YP22_9FUNG|nr:hypothetical protein K493DRAFT_348325 [Basidiobolus meristosporus CBS 931.73]|eukprot:ORX99769.1 hypothetical protein K493DRAFT_348325 [Basidiobolus meristosporus CBS 931.73]